MGENFIPTLQALKDNKVWLSSPLNFNDPFDSQLRMTSEGDSDIYTKINELNAEKFGNGFLTREEWRKNLPSRHLKPDGGPPYFSESIYEYLHGDGTSLGGLKEYFESKNCMYPGLDEFFNFYSDLGVCSFSRAYDDPKMWGHYSDSHQGFCVEFELDGELEGANIFNVNYLDTDEFPDPIGCSRGHNIEDSLLLEQVLLKSRTWKHENELRIISRDSNKHFIGFSGEVSKVCFGLRMSGEDRVKIDEILKFDFNKYNKAQKNTDYYKMIWSAF